MTQPLAPCLRAALRAHGKPMEVQALAEVIGVRPEIAMRAYRGRVVNADDTLKLCRAVKVDPLSGEFHSGSSPRGEFDWLFLAAGLRGRRYNGAMTIDIRNAAKAIGINIRILSRAENGQPVSAEALRAICRHYGMHPDEFTKPVYPSVTRETSKRETRASA